MRGWGRHYLLHILLEDAELQPLVEPHLAVLPDALEPPLVVQHLMYHVQHLVHCLGVVGRGREGLRVPRAQGPLQHIQQGFAILADLQEGEVKLREARSRQGPRALGRVGWLGGSLAGTQNPRTLEACTSQRGPVLSLQPGEGQSTRILGQGLLSQCLSLPLHWVGTPSALILSPQHSEQSLGHRMWYIF